MDVSQIPMVCIEKGKLLDIIEHPNQEKYKEQRCYVVDIENYVFIVPYVESEQSIFLKTIFPSRKYTKMYLHRRINMGQVVLSAELERGEYYMSNAPLTLFGSLRHMTQL